MSCSPTPSVETFHPAIDFEVYDGKDVASSSLLYDNNGVKSAGEKENAALFSKKTSDSNRDTIRDTRVGPVLRHAASIRERGQEQPTRLRARERCHREFLALRHHLDACAQPYASLPRKR